MKESNPSTEQAIIDEINSFAKTNRGKEFINSSRDEAEEIKKILIEKAALKPEKLSMIIGI